MARDKMLPEVRGLLDAHAELRKGSKGPDPHNTVLKSAVVFLCATWEYYCENLAQEAVKKLSEADIDPSCLPDAIKWQLKLAVHDSDPGKVDPLRLAGNGWRATLVAVAEKYCEALNSPKSKPVDELFQKCIGLKKVSENCSHERWELDKFVGVRGDIAHKGSDAAKVSREEVTHYLSVISKSITDTDNAVYEHLKYQKLIGKAAWQKTK